MEQPQCFVIGLPGPAIIGRHAVQEIVVGIQAPGRFAFRALDLGLLDPGRHCTDHARRNLVLQIEDVRKRAIETVRPDVGAV